MIQFSLKRISTVGPKSGWGGVGLSQTRPIPRSPDGDKTDRLAVVSDNLSPINWARIQHRNQGDNFSLRAWCLYLQLALWNSQVLLSHFSITLICRSLPLVFKSMGQMKLQSNDNNDEGGTKEPLMAFSVKATIASSHLQRCLLSEHNIYWSEENHDKTKTFPSLFLAYQDSP